MFISLPKPRSSMWVIPFALQAAICPDNAASPHSSLNAERIKFAILPTSEYYIVRSIALFVRLCKLFGSGNSVFHKKRRKSKKRLDI